MKFIESDDKPKFRKNRHSNLRKADRNSIVKTVSGDLLNIQLTGKTVNGMQVIKTKKLDASQYRYIANKFMNKGGYSEVFGK